MPQITKAKEHLKQKPIEIQTLHMETEKPTPKRNGIVSKCENYNPMCESMVSMQSFSVREVRNSGPNMNVLNYRYNVDNKQDVDQSLTIKLNEQ